MESPIVKVVSQRGIAAYALDGTPFRFEVGRRTSRSWRWRAWHVWGPRTVGEGIERLRVNAVLAAAQCVTKAAADEAPPSAGGQP
jgi:hypothetical protein